MAYEVLVGNIEQTFGGVSNSIHVGLHRTRRGRESNPADVWLGERRVLRGRSSTAPNPGTSHGDRF